MMRAITLSTFLVLIALLLCSTSQPFLSNEVSADTSTSQTGTAQAITEEVAGLRRVIITTQQGNKVYVNLPDDMAAGDTISGSVFAEATGKTDAERAANLLELQDQFIEIAGQRVPATGKTFELKIPALPPQHTIAVVLRDKTGKEVAKADLPVAAQALSPATSIKLPTYGQAGGFIEIDCPCDGVIAGSDYVRITGQDIQMLAESPRKRVAFNTNTEHGLKDIEISEGRQVTKGKISVLGIRLSVATPHLLRGEKTTLTVEVTGLEGLREDVPLRLENRTPSMVTMEPANVQRLTIKPGEVQPGGIFITQRTLTGIQPGAFSIISIVVRRAEFAPATGNQVPPSPAGQPPPAIELTVIARQNNPAQTRLDNQELARLFAEEQADYSSSRGKSIEVTITAARHRARLTNVREIYARNELRTGADYNRAAQLLLRGEGPEDYRLGRQLSAAAVGKTGSIQPPQTGPEQDCNGAIPVCQPTYTQSQSYTGVGNSQEVIAGTCLGAGESNSVWYIFTALTSGSLTFTINTANDYDFALYNISNGGCAAVPTSQPIRCNYSGTSGTTGLTLPAQPETPGLSEFGFGNPLMPGVDVTAGQTYVLLVNNYTGDQNGYTLTFGGTASIFDSTPPTIQSSFVDEATCTIEIVMSEPVRCSSIAADGSDFQMLTTGGPVLTGASGVNCGTFTNKIRLTYSISNPNLNACGSWRIGSRAGTDGNTLIDNCGNSLATHSTVTVITTPPATAGLTLTGDTFCEGAPIIADGSGSIYENKHFWSIVESDANWNVIGQEYSEWFNGPAGTLDVRQFAAQKGLVLGCGKFYRVKLAVGSCCTPWNETVRLIYIRCPPRADGGPDKTVCSCCGPQKLQIGAPGVAGMTYSWSPTTGLDNPTSPNPTIDFSTFNGTGIPFPSVYEVTVTDADGCTAKDSVFIKTVCGCRPSAKVTVTHPNICSRTYTLTADCTCGSDTTPSYLWSPGGATTQSIEVPGGSGPYTVTCRNECGATVSQPITVPPATPLEGGFPNIQCPNVFTPNGDNVNDRWTVLDTTHPSGFTPAYNATEYQLEVFNRWGSRVALLNGNTTTGFANNSIPGWDGTATQNAFYSWWQRTFGGRKNTYAGQPVSDGTYYYIFRLRNCTTDWTDICHGFITVLR